MLSWSNVLELVVFSVGLMSFLKVKKNFLSSLISLEMMVVSASLVFFLEAGNAESLAFFPAFLTLVVCEGALGLSVLVLMARDKGTSFMNYSGVTAW